MSRRSRRVQVLTPVLVIMIALSLQSSPVAAANCVCSFDFDNTLRVAADAGDHINYDSPAPEANAVFQACQSIPCNIGIASANRNIDKIKCVLTKNYGTGVFNDQFFNSPAFQYGQWDKAHSLKAQSDFFKVPISCVVLFDDTYLNKNYANRAGALFEAVDPYKGVAKYNFDHALSYMPSYCKGNQG